MRTLLLLFFLSAALFVQSQNAAVPKFESKLKILKVEADKGNINAMIQLAEIYQNGKEVERDYTTALHWYLKAANKGNPAAMNMVGRYYDEGYGEIEKDSILAIKYTKMSAEAGNPSGQYNYGYYLYYGTYVKQNWIEARKWFEKSIISGSLLGNYYLGLIYYYGEGVEKDYKKAYNYFSFYEDSASSKYMMGKCLFNGHGVNIDKEKALKYFIDAANKKNLSSLLFLGDIYYSGNYVPKDKIKARSYYEEGLKLKSNEIFKERLDYLFPDFDKYSPRELYDRAFLYYSSETFSKQADDGKFYPLDSIYHNNEFYKTALELSVAKNHIPAKGIKAYNLYYGKEGYKCDKKAAISMAKPIANKSLTACNILANYFETEKKNYKEAFEYYEISANTHNSKNAKKKLAEYYHQGKGVKKNIEKAIHFYREANENDMASNLCQKYGFMDENEYKKLIDQLWNDEPEKAFNLSKEGTAKGYHYCQAILGFCYNLGHGVAEDSNKVIELLEPIKEENSLYALHLGIAYQNLKMDKEAYLIFKKLVESDYPDAYSCFSDCYIMGRGINQNIPKGIEILNEGARKHNDAICLNDLGFMYLHGIGVNKNPNKAFEYYKKASELDYFSNARTNLAICYLKGTGIKQDKDKAIKMLEEEAEKGNNSAKRILGECYLLGDGVNANYSKAFSYFDNSKTNYISKLYNAICYELGLGVDRDLHKSRQFLSEIDERYLKIYSNQDSIIYEYHGVTGYPILKITTLTNEKQGLLNRSLCIYSPGHNYIAKPLLSAIPLPSSTPNISESKLVATGNTPEIFITNFNDGDNFSDKDVELIYRFFPSDSEITKFDIKINGEKIRGERGFSRQGELSLNLPEKDSRIDIIPHNQYGKGKTTTIYLKWKPKQDIRPNLYILALGVNNYQFYNKLKYPIKDMRSFIDLTKEKSKNLYKKVSVKSLSNETVTIRNIKKELSSLINEVQEEDFVFIYYAGHGDVLDDQYYLIPIDGEKDDIRSTCLKSSDFMDDVNSIKGKVVLFVDACYSGNLISSRSGASTDMYEALTALRKLENDVYIFTSSADKTKSVESEEWEAGLFTKVLLEAFRGKARRNNEAILTTESLRQYLIEEMRKLYKDQTPRFSSMPDFPLLAY